MYTHPLIMHERELNQHHQDIYLSYFHVQMVQVDFKKELKMSLNWVKPFCIYLVLQLLYK